MNLPDLVPLFIVVAFVGLLIAERVFPATAQPAVKRWFGKGVLFFVLSIAMSGAIPAVALELLGDGTVLHLAGLGTVGGVLVTLAVADLLGYWVHRGMHNSAFVWRWTHQLHHSAERLDMMGAVYFHPLDFLLQNVLLSLAITIVLGVSPEAAAVAGMIGFFFGVSPHLNVRTPRWLGYVIQRPEMHAVHHQREVHAYNYGVFALSDLLFGTWRNPATFPAAKYGFWDGASAEVGAMLIGRDVSTPKAPEVSQALARE